MDEHVKWAITNGLRKRGIDVLTVQEDGYTGADDSKILDRAKQLGRIVFTCDDDFLVETTRRQKENIPFASVAYIQQLRVNIGQCIEDLVYISEATLPGETLNEVWFLPL